MKLLWCDIETSGLNPRENKILEIATQLTDLYPNPFGEARPDPSTIYEAVIRCQNTEIFSPFILDMHTKNGLLVECAKSEVDLLRAESRLLEIVPEVVDKDERTVLAGASVHFDLGFLRAHMPTLAARLSHRVYDVSAVKLFCRSLGMSPFPKVEDLPHRAMVDLKESMNHAWTCMRWLENWFHLTEAQKQVALATTYPVAK